MKIFISWSGSPSREVAEIMRKYLPYMIPGLNAFMSQHDIESGTRWILELADNLERQILG